MYTYAAQVYFVQAGILELDTLFSFLSILADSEGTDQELSAEVSLYWQPSCHGLELVLE